MLSKMETIYDEATKKANKLAEERLASSAPPPPPAAAAKESVAEKAAALEALTKHVEAAVARLIDKQADAREGNPINQGIDAAIRKVVENLAVGVMVDDQELQAALKEQITTALKDGLFGDKEE
jgi:DNA-binding ferritin-like protein